MPVINVLPKNVAELIAAGEVVERPASVIKELVENSIDAGATAITVEIQRGGITYMRVTDNGCGIEHNDVPKAFLRHATSKIKIGTDLDSIATLGFRGEALAAVSAVSRVQMLTCSKESEIGTSYSIEGGEQTAYDEAGCPKGTTIIIRDIFYNTPARMKFLKKDVSEGNACAAVVDRIALSHPEISFKFIREGKQTLATSGDNNRKNTVYSVLGRDFSSGLIEAGGKSGVPPVERRRELSAPDQPHGDTLAAVLCREGLYPFAESVVCAKRLRRSARIGALLCCVSSGLGILLTGYLVHMSAYGSLSPLNLLLYLLMWLLPVWLLTAWTHRF